MPVRLDQVPPLAARPAPLRVWLWLGALPLLVLLGVAVTVLFSTQPLAEQPPVFWLPAWGVPLAVWCVLSFARALLYIGQQGAADGWDEAREEDLTRRISRGRRSQQILGASLYTALRALGAQPAAQRDALLSGTRAYQAQPSWQGETLLHSRLPVSGDEGVGAVVYRLLVQVLTDLAHTLKQLPDAQPLALLLEIECALPKNQLRQIWQHAWRDSGIRQSAVPAEGEGLTALDHRLDQHIGDQALLMVVALQVAPSQPQGTAEAAVGLLFGNRLTQTTLPPMAHLHRPEQEREPSAEHLLYATRQALDWVPLEAKAIEQVWRAGIAAPRDMDINAVLSGVAMPVNHHRELCDLDALLGSAGHVSPWLAIAAATQTIERGVGPQFIFSGDGAVETGLWGSVLMPVPPLS